MNQSHLALEAIAEKPTDLLSVKNAARVLDLHPGTLRAWLAEHRLPYVKIGRLTKLRRADLDALIARHTVEATSRS